MSAPPFPLILASASLRRLKLLAQIGVVPSEIVAAAIDETPHLRELPPDYATRVANHKLDKVAARYSDALVLAADTVVAVGRRILPKAGNEANARTCLALLSGRRHSVHTAVVARSPKGGRSLLVTTHVRFKRLTSQEIDAYLATGEWCGKAGGYAIQGYAAAFIPWIQGSYSNVVGLPLLETRQLLVALQ